MTSVLAPVKTLPRAIEVRQRAVTFWVRVRVRVRVRVSGTVFKLEARGRNEKDAICIVWEVGWVRKPKRGREGGGGGRLFSYVPFR